MSVIDETPKFKIGDKVWTRLVVRIPEWTQEERVQITGIRTGKNVRYAVSYIQEDNTLRPMNAYLLEKELSETA